MGLTGKDPQGQPTGPDGTASCRIEHSQRRILSFFLKELASAEDLERIRTLVDALPELLSEHFSDEEGPEGLFDCLQVIRPAIDSQLKFLRQEHRTMLKTVEELRQQVRGTDQAMAAGQEEQRLIRIRESTTAFLRMVRCHERVETRLVADTYYAEDGGSG
jgi:hemerythrin